MPIAEHKDWCSIFRGEAAMKSASAASGQR
jgi:hypothetical protein